MRCYCNTMIEDVERRINLYDTTKEINRRIYVTTCPKCGEPNAELFWFDVIRGYEDSFKPKKKHRAAWLKKYEEEPYTEIVDEPDQGSYSNMNWIKGTRTKNSEFAVDFNDIVRLVRTTSKKIFNTYRKNNLLYFTKDFQGEKTLVSSL